MDDNEPQTPEGIDLWDPHDAPGMRKMIERDVVNALGKYAHGFEYGNVRLELADLHIPDKEEFSKDEQREAMLSDKTLARRVRGTVRLVDTESGKVLDTKKNHTLLRIPWLSERGTWIHNGTNYAPVSQSRLLSGPYTRKRDNGFVECHINARPGTGRSMHVTLDPETAQYRIKVGGTSGSSNVHAYSLFNALGVSDADLEKRWGKDVLEMNKVKVDPKALDRFYERSVPKWGRPETEPTQEEKAELVRKALDATQVSQAILHENLPTLVDREKAASWRALGAAMDKAARMSKEAATPFDPDLTPSQLATAVAEIDFDAHMTKRAFSPDLPQEAMQEARNYLHGGFGPRLASMAAWPEHWLNDQDPTGWLEWYEKYAQGRRTPDDSRQIMRWKRFKRLHGGHFIHNPTPRRAYALRNWAIDPLKLLPVSERDSMQEQMDRYRNVEYMKWVMTRPGFDAFKAERMLLRATHKGFKGEGDTSTQLLDAAAQGFITPDDM